MKRLRFGAILIVTALVNVAPANLVGYWGFDEETGTAVFDFAGNHHGLIHGGATRTTGISGSALQFDGVDDYVALPDNEPVWLPTNDFTLSIWLYPERMAGTHEVFVDLNFGASSNPDNELGCSVQRLLSGELRFAITTLQNTDEILGVPDVLNEADQWYHLVAVRRGTFQGLYVNGVLVGSRTCSASPIKYEGGYDDDRINIGRTTTRGTQPRFHFKGRLDELALYNNPLSQNAIRNIYEDGLAQLAARDLIGYWGFDEADGKAVFDAASNHHGLIHNGTLRTEGIAGNALEFDGIDDYAALPNNEPVWLPREGLTISFWLYPERIPGTHEAFVDLNYGASSDPDNELGCIVQRVISGDLVFGITTLENTDEVLFVSDVLNEADQWYHLAAVRKGTFQGLYVNGVLVGSRICSASPIIYEGGYDDNHVSIGHFTTSFHSPRHHFKGLIDEVALYDKALSQRTIQTIYQDGVAEELTPNPLAPNVQIQSPLDITETSAKLVGLITDSGNKIYEHRFRYWIEGQPENTTPWQPINVGPVYFVTTVNDLIPGTRYQCIAEARNAFGIGASEVVSFTTLMNN